MDRRRFLQSTAVAAVAAGYAPLPAFAQDASRAGDAPLDALFDAILADTLDHSPELATSLGMDKGARASAKGRLNDRSLDAMRAALARNRRWRDALEALPGSSLSPAGRLNRRIVSYSLDQQAVAPTRFGIDSVIRPYRIFQQGGAYFEVPDFLNDTHVVATAADADAYLSRLEAFATALDQDTAVQRAQAPRGYVAPGFALDLTLGQMQRLRAAPPADSNLVADRSSPSSGHPLRPPQIQAHRCDLA